MKRIGKTGRKIWNYFLIALILLSSLSCSKKEEKAPIEVNSIPKLKLVRAVQIKNEEMGGRVEYVGTLVSSRKVNVATEMGGTIESIFFERGDRIEKGKLLAEINTRSRSIILVPFSTISIIITGHNLPFITCIARMIVWNCYYQSAFKI